MDVEVNHQRAIGSPERRRELRESCTVTVSRGCLRGSHHIVRLWNPELKGAPADPFTDENSCPQDGLWKIGEVGKSTKESPGDMQESPAMCFISEGGQGRVL